MKTILKLLIKFYQKYISPLTPASCRYYPTCSEYALWQFENNTIFKAIYFTITRILKCNQLFQGGLDYPVVKYKYKHNIIFKKINVKYWYVPISKDDCYVIKNWECKKKNGSTHE
ncbi:MAG: membrane protein insertion efficiency factor YidD [Candidatus Marinarcus sp.]|uniref:membrane protein insertion efficiency factor YidD n=1 Tax=Candidatus Marinarcus sp. TaxID=3100987 RepID=UPI003AFF943C